MRTILLSLLFLTAVLAGLACAGLFAVSESAVHEVEALIAGLASVCAFGLGTVGVCVEHLRHCTVDAINRNTAVAINEAKIASAGSR
jgi:hypothetical protein